MSYMSQSSSERTFCEAATEGCVFFMTVFLTVESFSESTSVRSSESRSMVSLTSNVSPWKSSCLTELSSPSSCISSQLSSELASECPWPDHQQNCLQHRSLRLSCPMSIVRLRFLDPSMVEDISRHFTVGFFFGVRQWTLTEGSYLYHF